MSLINHSSLFVEHVETQFSLGDLSSIIWEDFRRSATMQFTKCDSLSIYEGQWESFFGLLDARCLSLSRGIFEDVSGGPGLLLFLLHLFSGYLNAYSRPYQNQKCQNAFYRRRSNSGKSHVKRLKTSQSLPALWLTVKRWSVAHRMGHSKTVSSVTTCSCVQSLFIELFLGLTPPAGCTVWAQIWEREDLIAFASNYHDSMLGLCWPWSYVGSKLGRVGSMLGLRGALLGPRRLMFGQNWGYFGGMLGLNGSMLAHFEVLLGLCWPMWGLCWGQVRPSRAMLGLWQTAQPDFVSKTLPLPGIGITKMSPGQVYVGRSWGYVGVCWGQVQISWSYLGAWLPLRRWFWASLFSGPHLHSQILLEKVPASGLRDSCLYSLSQSLLFFSSPHWPASFKFQAFLLPPVACESQVPPKRGVGGRVGSPP